MEKFVLGIRHFLQDEEGVTAIEYGLIAALIAVVIIAAVTLIGNELNQTFDCIGQKLGNSAFVCT